GEREIREAADHLRKHLAPMPALRNAEVLSLFARLSQAEQDRIFEPHGGRRIVLATNVAETSLTVPGIRYVIDAGTARVKRYSFRSKVEQLLVEPVSQAAANQRAGRCGRVADGICIRLYDEADYQARARFTDPEILRSSLAGVILRMKALRLGPVEEFPFLERPSGRAIADGYQLLAELGAVDDTQSLTPIGQELARLPLDPRVGRMILAARDRHALDEVLVIAAALSVQDVRDRPLDQQAQADAAHARFDDEKSEFSGYLRLWKWLDESRGGRATDSGAPEHRLSHRQFEALLRQHFISVRRVREWRDIHSQLHTVVAEHQWRLNTRPASYEQLHLAMLAGLLGNVGCRSELEGAQGEYLGARGIKFYPHPGAHLSKKPGRWVVAAELVETTRLYGRGLAVIDPAWLEQVGAHLLKKQLLDPHWEKKAGEVVALERATLYGLLVYSGRRVAYSRVDPAAARDLFIREALVAGQWETSLPFLAANQALVREVEELEHKARRQDVLVDEELIVAFYDRALPAEVCSARTLEDWYRHEVRQQPSLLRLTRDELMRHAAAGITGSAFPARIRLGGIDCQADYLHEPGDPRDGLTVSVPLYVLNQVSEERCEWLVPGMLKDKVLALLKSLHQRPRSRLVPLPQTAERFAASLLAEEVFGQGPLVDALLRLVRAATSVDIERNDFKQDSLSPHHFMNYRVVDEHGRQLGAGRNLAALKADLGHRARGAFQALAALKTGALPAASGAGAAPGSAQPARPHTAVSGSNRAVSPVKSGDRATKKEANGGADAPAVAGQRYTAWQFGELPELLEIRKGAQSLIGYPALVDLGDAVGIEVFDEPHTAAQRHRVGLRRLFALQIREALKYLEKNIPDLQKMAVAYLALGRQGDAGSAGGASLTLEGLREQIVALALDRAFLADPLPLSADAFGQRLDEGRARLNLIAQEVARLASAILLEYGLAQRKLRDSRQATQAVADCSAQLARLVTPRFLVDTPWAALQHLPRYLKAVVLRLDKWRADPARDAARQAEIQPLEQRFWRRVAERKGVQDERLAEFRWLPEELRVSLYAQELRTPQPVSVKRLDKAWALLSL
ncbi:MAG: ATP-dependent RNA helicase HrpA, partial [Rhodoferax sp.]|nr:ATP-dependent RNA helicase HrpA [Rhodoferax sp.]